jgi:probable DNA repair protein
MDVRARLDERLRRRCPPGMTAERLARAASSSKAPHAPMLLACLERFGAARKASRSVLNSAADWAKVFSESLAALGFPGERTLDSNEFQALSRWHELLAEFATLERVTPRMGYEEARERLSRMAADTIFQPEGHDAPIRILGVLESAGLEFDHLWVMGLTDEAWPLAARPNPFLSARLQRNAGIPQADPVSSLELDRRITEGWLRAAGEVVVSHARMKEESELAPSPLIAAIAPVTLEELAVAPQRTLRDALRGAAAVETIDDANAPAILEAPTGGTRVFRDQAACPFRAFAHARLACGEMEAPRPGLDLRDRGTLVHGLLASLWKALGTRERLAAMPPADLDALVAQCADEALAQMQRYRHEALSGRFGTLERERLVRTAKEWLRIELQRDDFEVVSLEEKRPLAFGGVTVNVKLDRVDRLPGGAHVVLDYKTGDCKTKSWLGARPEEPQMPMYALGVDDVAAVAFAQVKAGEMGFRGLQREEGVLPTKVYVVDKDRFAKTYRDWPGLLASLRSELDALGAAYAAGDARVDPKRRDTCALCDQQMACRIAEKAPLGAVGGSEADE